ncbi:hypothetical protein JW710_02035 [Candidatus Dojkabacteria bacterium]|nr:hypothetical protein [Candidatus Dojkabacteria bacterium]
MPKSTSSSPDSAKPTEKKSKIPLVIVILTIVIILIVSCCACFSLGSNWNSSNDSENTESKKSEEGNKNASEDDDNEEEEDQGYQNLSVRLEDFNKKKISDLRDLLGDPSETEDNELPLFSSIFWDKGDYDVLIEFKKGEDLVYGGMITFTDMGCEGEELSKEDVETVMNRMSAKYASGEWKRENQGYRYVYRNRDFEDWESLMVACDEGVYILAQPDGYSDWAAL